MECANVIISASCNKLILLECIKIPNRDMSKLDAHMPICDMLVVADMTY